MESETCRQEAVSPAKLGGQCFRGNSSPRPCGWNSWLWRKTGQEALGRHVSAARRVEGVKMGVCKGGGGDSHWSSDSLNSLPECISPCSSQPTPTCHVGSQINVMYWPSTPLSLNTSVLLGFPWGLLSILILKGIH